MKEQSLVYKGLELSKIVDGFGILVGIGMMAFGMVGAGVGLVAVSGVTYAAAGAVQRNLKT